MEKVELLLQLLRDVCPREGLKFKFEDFLQPTNQAKITLEIHHVPSAVAMKFRRDSEYGFTEDDIVDFLQTCLAKMLLWSIEGSQKVKQPEVNG